MQKSAKNPLFIDVFFATLSMKAYHGGKPKSYMEETMKKLLVALLVLGVSNAFAMGVDAGWTNESLFGNRPVVQAPVASEVNPVNQPAVDAGWNEMGLGINRSNVNRPYINAPATSQESVDAGWNLQDLR